MLYVIVIILILLLAFIILSAYKLSIYFNTFMFLSKKINYDKTNYISNSSFFKFFYSNNVFYGYFGIEFLFTAILVILSITAYGGYINTNHMNYGFLNNNYGDATEFNFINIFIYTIIAFAFLYGGSYMYWMYYDKAEDNKLYDEEKALKELFLDNLDYTLLYDYYKKTTIKDTYSLEDYTMDIKDPKLFKDNPDNVFRYCFTYYILNDKKDKKFTLIKKEILDIIKGIDTISGKTIEDLNAAETANISKIKDAINNTTGFYIISKYNHNNNNALRPLDVMIEDVIKLIGEDAGKKDIKADLDAINLGIRSKKYTDPNIKAIMVKFDKTQYTFMSTIKMYKEIYDKYYMYYMYSVLLTNFIIIYAILVFSYILIKIGVSLSEEFDDNYFNIYYFTYYLNNYGLYLLILYYFISCPIILFGFN